MEVNVYLSHAIRGAEGSDATQATMDKNCAEAMAFARDLHKLFCHTVVPLSLYVPAVGDEFVQIAYRRGLLTEEEILDVDCEIIDKRDILVAYSPEGLISNGMKYEIDYAREHGIPTLIMSDLSVDSLLELMRMVLDAVERKRLMED